MARAAQCAYPKGPLTQSGEGSGLGRVTLCRDNRVDAVVRFKGLPRLPLSYVPSCRRRKQPYDNRRIELISRKLLHIDRVTRLRSHSLRSDTTRKTGTYMIWHVMYVCVVVVGINDGG